MKKTLVLFAILATCYVFSQQHKNLKEIKVTKLSYEVETADELQSIDWKTIKDVFTYNRNNEEVEMSFAIIKKGKRTVNTSIKVVGNSDHIERLIVLAKKGVASICKVLEKYKK